MKIDISTAKWAGAGFGLALAQALITNALHKKKVIVVPAETATEEFQPYLPEPQHLDADLMRLLDEEAARMKAERDPVVEDSTLHIPMVVEDAEDDVEVPQPWTPFSDFGEEWDHEKELESRTADQPYIINSDEYIEDEMGFHQQTVTYYAGDDIMADMNDVPIYNWASIMGALRWGHGSKDKNVVYIRNEKLRKEWEVLLHSGSYEIEVSGLQLDEDSELKHSLRKFRDD